VTENGTISAGTCLIDPIATTATGDAQATITVPGDSGNLNLNINFTV
jgi:hypothetical protein